MNAIPFPESNGVFTKPPSMTDEECVSLHVHDTGAALVSCWQLTDEERAAIAAGAPLWLWVIGRGHPPVSLQVETPFERPAPAAPRETPPDEQRGLYRKYEVKRLHDPTGKHADCGYYVLDLDHDRFAAPALRTYADACEAEYPELARDLRIRAEGSERMTGAASTGERGGDAPAECKDGHDWRPGRLLPTSTATSQDYDEEWCGRCGARFSEAERYSDDPCGCGAARDEHGGPYGEGACESTGCEAFHDAASPASGERSPRAGTAAPGLLAGYSVRGGETVHALPPDTTRPGSKALCGVAADPVHGTPFEGNPFACRNCLRKIAEPPPPRSSGTPEVKPFGYREDPTP